MMRQFTPEELAFAKQHLAELESQAKNQERHLASMLAREDLIEFTRLTMPSPEDPEDPNLSRYTPEQHHIFMADEIQAVERGDNLRLILSIPPRHGKSELATRRFPAWFIGRDPTRHAIIATYNDTFAEDFGRDVREILLSPEYQLIFPGAELKTGSKAADRLRTTAGGQMLFLGRGGGATGRGADLLLIDDPYKNRDEADSPTIREKAWTWFTQVAMSRLMTHAARVIIIMCMTGDTPVLMADGTTKLLKDVRPGDKVATHDKGKLAATTVTNWKSCGIDSVFEIKTSSGITVKANERHPFLVSEEGELRWIRTKDLRLGHEICRVNGASGKGRRARGMAAISPSGAGGTAFPTTTRSGGLTVFGRLLSMLRAAARPALSTDTGSLTKSTTDWLRNKAGFVLAAASPQATTFAPIGAGSCASTIATKPMRFEGSCVTTATWPSATGKTKKPSPPQQSISDFTLDEIVEIRPAGREEVFDVEIERTENFIANGLVSHNTRWHEDDIVGRLTDPENPAHNPKEAAKWRVVNVPSLCEDEENDVFGRKKDEALWPARFPTEFLESVRDLDPRGFSALYQGRPTPIEGDFFRNEWVKTYGPGSMPNMDELRLYAASDHAVSTKQSADSSVFLVGGVDPEDNLYILDCWWRQAPADIAVEGMVDLMERYPLLMWWAERGHISKSVGPFLRKRMHERGVYRAIEEVTPVNDKATRAGSIQGRMAQGKVFFPRHAPWFQKAKHQMLTFPHGSHDDFVDALALFGLGLNKQIKGRRATIPKKTKVGTFGHMKAQSRAMDRRERMQRAAGGF